MIGYSIAVSVIAIMISVGGIVLGVGLATDNRRLKEFGRDELIQSIINGTIVGSLLLFFSPYGFGMNAINGLVTGSGIHSSCQGSLESNYAICFANNYLVGISPVQIGNASYPSLLDSSLELLIPISGLYVTMGMVASAQLNLGVASFSFATVLAPIISQQEFLIKTLTFAIIGIYVQDALLRVVALVAVPFILPVGVVLRTFYPTRRLGGTMIAIAIGLFAVFPLTYVLDAQITASYSIGNVKGIIGQLLPQSASIQSDILGAGNGAVSSNSITGFGRSLINGVSQLAASTVTLLQDLVNYVAMLVVQVFFFPIFSIILTITAIRELARILGSEVSFGKFDIF